MQVKSKKKKAGASGDIQTAAPAAPKVKPTVDQSSKTNGVQEEKVVNLNNY